VYGDFSRVLDALPGQYSAVLAQQGRLLLDAELNEQTAIVLEYLRRLTADLVGPFAGPVHHCGFAVELVVEDGKCHAVRLSRGHYYVYGLRCESPAPHQRADAQIAIGEHEAPFVVYLVVWEQTISAIQAPELIDPAIAGSVPDTTRRSQVCWRPMAARRLNGRKENLAELEPDAIIRAFHEYDSDPHHRPALGARAHSSSGPEPGPDMAPTSGGYRGVENQLYRVEVHRGGEAGDATFKWSRDNGSVEFGLEALSELDSGQRTATLHRVWTDARQGLEIGDWVELVDDHWAPLGTPPPLMRVSQVTLATRQVVLEDSDEDRQFDTSAHPLLRRWDQQPNLEAPSHGIPVGQADGKWLELEDGVQILFEARDARYERGDFWWIPARTATAGVLWPQSRDERPAPLALPPHGPARYLVPLALVKELQREPIDLRLLFTHHLGRHGSRDEEQMTFAAEVEVDLEPTAIRPPEVGFRLRSIANAARGAVFGVHDGTMVGREAGATIRIDHPDVSREHAEFRLVDDVLTIMDRQSTNGTKVNGEPLTPLQPRELKVGDTIEFGSREVRLELEEER
jgi:hypothetical protein